jgi:uncharacterized protein (TIGR00251 family)
VSGPVRESADAVELDVQVVPRASRSRVVGLQAERVKVQLAAPPVDGAANEELEVVLARALDVPRRDVALVRGATSKKKTMRIAGLTAAEVRRRLGLPIALALSFVSAGCKPLTTSVAVGVLLPEDRVDLERTNNVSLTLEPDGFVETVATDGLDFALSFELPPNEEKRSIGLFLADDETLLAWGRTPEVTLRGAQAGLSVLVARPGGLSAFPEEFDAPDPDALAAVVADVGVLVLAADGGALFMDTFAWEIVVASSLPGAPMPSDGVLVSDPALGVQRLAWAQGLAAWRYDPTEDDWSERSLGDHGVEPRPDAASVALEDEAEVLVIGGGDALDIVAIALGPEATSPVRRVEGAALDVPRPGASALRVGSDAGAVTLVFGAGVDEAGDPTAALWWIEGQRAIGPEVAWTGGRCVALDDAAPRILCGGGVRDGTPTADALDVAFSPDGEVQFTEHVGVLGMPMADPIWFRDDVAVYAQGGGRLIALARGDLAATEREAASARDTGGHVARLPTGLELVVGGRAADGTPLSAWHVFAPEPS